MSGPFTDRDVSSTFDELNADGESPPQQFRNLACAGQYGHLYRLASRHVGHGATVLDWGCGNGHFSFHLARLGLKVVAFSFDEEPEIFGRLTPEERGRVTHVRGSPGDAVRLPFDDARFDHVFSVGVLEHVRETGGNETASLAEIRRVTRPGGSFICYHLPNRLSWIEALGRILHPGPPAPEPACPGYHRYRFDVGQIRAMCTAARLSVVEVRAYGVLPRNPLVALPAPLRSSRPLAGAWNALDRVLEGPFAPIAQNWYFVATV
jgi:SAM-dependent methyltransferase